LCADFTFSTQITVSELIRSKIVKYLHVLLICFSKMVSTSLNKVTNSVLHNVNNPNLTPEIITLNQLNLVMV